MQRKYDLLAQEKRLGLNFGKQLVSKRLYNVGDFSPYNLIWQSTLPKDIRSQYKLLAERNKAQLGQSPTSSHRKVLLSKEQPEPQKQPVEPSIQTVKPLEIPCGQKTSSNREYASFEATSLREVLNKQIEERQA